MMDKAWRFLGLFILCCSSACVGVFIWLWIDGGIAWGVFVKDLLLGLIALAIGVPLAIGFIAIRHAFATTGHDRRFRIAAGITMISVAGMSLEPFLEVLGVPELPILDRHVLLLLGSAIGIVVGLIGVIYERGDRLW